MGGRKKRKGWRLARGEGVAGPASGLFISIDVVHDIIFPSTQNTRRKFSFPKFEIQNQWQHSRYDKVGEVAEVELWKKTCVWWK